MIEKILTELRNKRQLSRKEVAQYLGIHETTYGKYELGHREPDFETLKKLAVFFETTASYLLGETNDPSPVDTSGIKLDDIEFALFGEVKELSEEDKEELLKNAQRLNEIRLLRQQIKE